MESEEGFPVTLCVKRSFHGILNAWKEVGNVWCTVKLLATVVT